MKAALDRYSETGSQFEVFLDGRNSFSYFDPHALFFVILPPLLFESASGMNWHVLRKVLPSSLILALPGVLVNVALTGLCIKGFVTDASGHLLSWEASFLLGSILSATDPVAVVASLRSLGAPAKLSSLIDGESLLNDGSAYVVFLVFFDWVGAAAPDDEKLCPGSTPGAGCVALKALQLAGGGSAIGGLSGLIVRFWVSYARFLHNATLELTIILLGVYGSFFLAETLHCSGVLAVVVYGIVWSAVIWPRLSHEARHANHMVLATIAYLCDKIIFFVAGMVSMRFIRGPAACGGSEIIGNMVGQLFLLYLVIHVTRTVVVGLFAPALGRLGYGFNWKEGSILVYGGLRGALALAMGLIVEHNAYIHADTASAVAFQTSGIVFLTLVINGSTVDNLYRKLVIYPANKYRIRYLKKRLQHVEEECLHKGLRRCQKHWFFKDCNFEHIFQCVPNLANVEFDERTGRPQATGIVPVSFALKDLEYLANRHMQQQMTQHGKYLDNFEYAWQSRHQETTQYVTKWLKEAVRVAGEGHGANGDLLENVLDFEHGVLESRRLTSIDMTSQKARVYGTYVSRRSLARVFDAQQRLLELQDATAGDRSEASFSVKLTELAKERLFVGLTANIPTPESVTSSQGLLGRVAYSVGLDCSTCRVVYNCGDPEPVQLQTRWEALVDVYVYTCCSRGSCVIGKKTAGQILRGFQVGLWVQLIGEPGFVAVMQQQQRGTGSEVAEADAVELESPQVADQLTMMLTVPNAHRGRPALKPMPALESETATGSPIKPLGPGDEVLVKVQRSKGQPWRISFTIYWRDSFLDPELVGLLSLGEFPPEELYPVVEFRPLVPSSIWNKTMGEKRDALVRGLRGSNADLGQHLNEVVASKVKLSFQPDVIDEQESLHEVFITLFNTVSFLYRELHEGGVIGDVALRWLLEAASDALDCANRDKHAAQISDYKHVEQTAELEEAVNATVAERAGAPKRQKSFSTMKTGAPAQNPFSPIVVEYLSIEQKCSSSSRWDKYPRTWWFNEQVRSFGYGRTNAKVECLHAFIEAHERVLNELTQLERFASVRFCVKQVIAAAKRDLRLTEELNPRRFFYSKHALVLKICISGSQHILEHQVEEGWIAPSDAEPLLQLTRELLAEIETHRPKVVTNWRANSRDLGSGSLAADRGFFRSAWADIFRREVSGQVSSAALSEASNTNDRSTDDISAKTSDRPLEVPEVQAGNLAVADKAECTIAEI